MTQVHPGINIGLQYIRNTSEIHFEVTYTSTMFVLFSIMKCLSDMYYVLPPIPLMLKEMQFIRKETLGDLCSKNPINIC